VELAAAVLIAGPLGYFSLNRRRALGLYLLVWAVVFPIQTVVVHLVSPGDFEPLYFVVNAAILTGGIGLNQLGARIGARRASPASA
jgi:hypothetical protein